MIIANKNNLRKTWMIIKQVINQSKSTKSAGQFIYNDKTTKPERLGAVQATSHYLKQWWLFYWRIYASVGLNELK